MNLALSEDQILLRDTLAKALAKESTPARIRAAEPAGHDPALWAVFQDLGLPLLRCAEAHDGAGGSLFDAVLVAETLAERLATIPAIDALVAGGLLSALGTAPALQQLARMAKGGGPIALALHDARETPDQLVGAGAAAEAIVFRWGNELRLLAGEPGPPDPNTASLAARRLRFSHNAGTSLAQGPQAVAAFEAAVEEWKLLTAASIAAAAKTAIDQASRYARDRHAFGRPIGSFQGLAHPMADAYADVDGAALLVWRAVDAIALGEADAAALVSMSVWWASHTGVNATVKAMRAYGGYGMTTDYDAQLYYRRVTAWSLLMGDPAEELDRAALRLWAGDAPAGLPRAGEVAVSFAFPAHAQAAADIARKVFTEHMTDARQAWSFDSGDGFDPELYKKLAEVGVLYPDWPKAYGGGGYDPIASAAIHGVFVEFGWSHVVIRIADLFGKMIMHFGSDLAKQEILPQFARAEAFACLCYTEPGSGSDIFAAQTKATPDGDAWLIRGQKIFTSQGHLATYGLMLARTSEAEKHAGLTLFAVPLDQPGYSFTPIQTVGGDRTNSTFYDDVRCPDAFRLGDVNGGAKVLAAALTIEQGSADLYVGAIRELLAPALEWARTTERHGRPAFEDPAVRARLAQAATRMHIIDVLNRRMIWAFANGQSRKHYGPTGKLFGSESWIACSTDLMQLTAPFSLLQGQTTLGWIERQFRRAVPSTIYAGTSEVQRSLIAEAGLGLPRSRT